MFTLEQIKTAHAKVKSGADFPAYIGEIKLLGVTHYETYVQDGHSNFHGKECVDQVSPAKYDTLIISDNINPEQFRKDLLHHQLGKSDYFQFCRECAANGVEKWVVCLESMTCTYYDKTGALILVEAIPQ